MKVHWAYKWHIGGAGKDQGCGGMFQGGQKAAQGALVGDGIGDFTAKKRGGGRILSAGGGDQQGWAGPTKLIEQVLEDGLAVNFEMAFGQSHSRAGPACENGQGDGGGFGRSHGMDYNPRHDISMRSCVLYTGDNQ